MDGADCNRQFIKIHFHERDPVKDHFVTTNVYTGTPMVFIMNVKKCHCNIFHGLSYKISFL